MLEAHGLRYGCMSDDLLAILDTDQGRDLLENTNSLFAAIKRTFTMTEAGRSPAGTFAGLDTEYVIYTHFQ